MRIPPARVWALLVALAITAATGCTGQPGDSVSSQADQGAAQPDAAGLPPSELNAAHILIMHRAVAEAPDEVTRSKEEALALAREVAQKARAEGADFAALAREYSDCSSAQEGGELGNFAPREMVREFSAATAGLAVGEVSNPVESLFGYHVIRRQEVRVPRQARVRHILVQYHGSMKAEAHITRTKEEALARIAECLKKVEAGEKFADLVRRYSDGPSAPKGGALEKFSEGEMVPPFEEAAFACEVGEVTDVVETPFGYHIIYREE